jgi:hypothetical protein
MSTLKTYSYKGVGERNQEFYYYSQAVRLPAGADRIECSGQGMVRQCRPEDTVLMERQEGGIPRLVPIARA